MTYDNLLILHFKQSMKAMKITVIFYSNHFFWYIRLSSLRVSFRNNFFLCFALAYFGVRFEMVQKKLNETKRQTASESVNPSREKEFFEENYSFDFMKIGTLVLLLLGFVIDFIFRRLLSRFTYKLLWMHWVFIK